MTMPTGVSLATVTFGKALGALGTEATITATVALDRPIVWAATGETFYNVPDTVTATAGGFLSFAVPHVDQPGFIDAAGNAVTDFAYVLTAQVKFGKTQTIHVTKAFQVRVGQNAIDLDLVPGGSITPGVTAPGAVVLSVAGLTGPVTAAELRAALGVPTATELAATYATVPTLATKNATNVAMNQWGGSKTLCGHDPVTGFFYSYDSGGLYRATNPVTGWGPAVGLPAGVPLANNRMRVLRAGPWLYLLSNTSAGGATPPAIYRSDPTVLSWAKVHDLGAKTDAFWLNLAADDAYLYATEYSSAAAGEIAGGGPPDGVKVYRSPITDGATWATVLTIPNIAGGGVRHAHCIAPDPYRPGHVYATFGDTGADRYVIRSTDYGATWATVVNSLKNSFQAVQVSFTPKWVWFAGDGVSLGGRTVWVMDRDELTPKWATLDYHRNLAVPGGRPGRPVTDGAFTAGSQTLTSATANFTADDVGRMIYDTICVDDGAYITAVTNATTVTLSRAGRFSLAGQPFTIGGQEWYSNAYFGIADPATERFYSVAMDASVGGQVPGLFVLDRVGGRLSLVKRLHAIADGPAFIIGGDLYFHRFKLPLI